MGQVITLARFYFQDDSPDDETLAKAVWLHSELMRNISVAVQNGVAAAFKRK